MRAYIGRADDLNMEAALTETPEQRQLRVLYDEEGVWKRHLEKLHNQRLELLEQFKKGETCGIG